MNLKSEIISSVKVFFVFAVFFGLFYPLAITAAAQVLFPKKANGSLVLENGAVVGSYLIGQKFDSPKYFHSRPSAVDYDAKNSGADNFGPLNQKLFSAVQNRAKDFRKENNLPEKSFLPADALLTCASGLDPHISTQNAFMQLPRVMKKRELSKQQLSKLIRKNAEKFPQCSIEESCVNVLKLNLALDRYSEDGASNKDFN